jgi:hypothetical protein
MDEFMFNEICHMDRIKCRLNWISCENHIMLMKIHTMHEIENDEISQ